MKKLLATLSALALILLLAFLLWGQYWFGRYSPAMFADNEESWFWFGDQDSIAQAVKETAPMGVNFEAEVAGFKFWDQPEKVAVRDFAAQAIESFGDEWGMVWLPGRGFIFPFSDTREASKFLGDLERTYSLTKEGQRLTLSDWHLSAYRNLVVMAPSERDLTDILSHRQQVSPLTVPPKGYLYHLPSFGGFNIESRDEGLSRWSYRSDTLDAPTGGTVDARLSALKKLSPLLWLRGQNLSEVLSEMDKGSKSRLGAAFESVGLDLDGHSVLSLKQDYSIVLLPWKVSSRETLGALVVNKVSNPEEVKRGLEAWEKAVGQKPGTFPVVKDVTLPDNSDSLELYTETGAPWQFETEIRDDLEIRSLKVPDSTSSYLLAVGLSYAVIDDFLILANRPDLVAKAASLLDEKPQDRPSAGLSLQEIPRLTRLLSTYADVFGWRLPEWMKSGTFEEIAIIFDKDHFRGQINFVNAGETQRVSSDQG